MTVIQILTMEEDHATTGGTTTTCHNSHRLPLHNSDVLPAVHELFKRHPYIFSAGVIKVKVMVLGRSDNTNFEGNRALKKNVTFQNRSASA
jgi:hypothetical protein